MKSVGIDIGASSIKVVEVTTNNKGNLKISQFTVHPLGANPAFDPEIEILEFLRELTKSYDPAQTRFVLALRQDRVSIRHKVFPFNDRLKITKSLPFELEEDLPFSSDSAVFDAKIVRYLGSSAEVLAAATPKHRVLEVLKRFGDIGLDISILSTEGIALANCIEPWFEAPPVVAVDTMSLEGEYKPHRSLNLVVSIGHTRTLVTAFDQGRLVGVRSLLWGGKMVVDGIARRYEIPYIEALKEMQTKAFILLSKEGASYDQIVFSDTISHQFREMSRELKISMLELQSELNATVTNVQITGGTSQVLNLQAFLTQTLEVPVNRINVLEGFSNVGFEKSSRVDNVIGVALGLAIEGLKKPRNPALNLLKGDFAKQNTFFKKIWQDWGVAIQFAAAFYVAFFIYAVARDHVSLTLADRSVEVLKAQATTVAHLPKKQANENGVKKYIRDQKKQAQEIRTIVGLAKMNSALDLLKRVSEATPTKNSITLNVKKFRVEEDRVTIEGTVSNNNELAALNKAFAQISRDGKVSSQNPTLPVAPGSTVFATSFLVDRNISSSEGGVR